MTGPVPSAARASTLFAGVDVAVVAAGLVHRLRGVGVDVGPTAANRLALAMAALPPRDTDTFYWTVRVTLVADRRDLPAFDRVFAHAFGGAVLPRGGSSGDAGRAVIRTEGTVSRRSAEVDGLAEVAARALSLRPSVVDDDGTDADDPGGDKNDDPDDEGTSLLFDLLPSDLEELADRWFDALSDDELDRIGAWLTGAIADLPRRTTRRRRASPHGPVDLRRTLAGARGTGEVLTLVRRRPRTEPRPLVMVADVSGSMESFTRIHLHLLRAFALHARSGCPFEAFTLATSLRRITPQLCRRDAAEVVAALSAEVEDRFGGTRLATNLGELITSPRWSHAVRGATVVIASDGWDTDPPELLARRMARLRRMAHRVVWINPRAAAPDHRPETGGMAAALPWIDEVCSGHSLRAMGRVVAAVSRG